MRAGVVVSKDVRPTLGKRGEDLAADALRRSGYAIIERRYRTRFGEIDIVAACGEAIVFIEVKARTGDRFGEAAEAVTPLKQHRVARMAEDYVMRRGLHGRPCRFDVVTVDLDHEPPRVEVYRHAFDAPW